ncbi:hypothetical protein D3C84_307060 [compost metagenome]
MPASIHATTLCRYQFDPLDRLGGIAPSALDRRQRYYCKSRVVTEVQGTQGNSFFQHEGQLLAQQSHEKTGFVTTLLATDQQRSVLYALDATGPHPCAYTPYGHRSPESGLLSLLGFNGERRDPLTGHYHLGNGYRQFNPVLMRFNSPDTSSPFGKGGVNAYMYCVGDPINQSDPTGHFPFWQVVSGVSAAIGAASIAGGLIAEDKTLKWMFFGLAAVSAIVAGGASVKLFMKPRQPGSTVGHRSVHNTPTGDLEVVNVPRLDPDLPTYWDPSQPASPPPPYSPDGQTLPQRNSPPPAYEFQDSNPYNLTHSGSRSPSPTISPLTRFPSNESLPSMLRENPSLVASIRRSL